MKVKLLSHVRPLVTPWTAAYQAPPSMGFSGQEYWSRVPLPSPNKLSRLIITFLPRSKRLLISWLQSPSAVIFGLPENKVCHCFHCSMYIILAFFSSLFYYSIFYNICLGLILLKLIACTTTMRFLCSVLYFSHFPLLIAILL